MVILSLKCVLALEICLPLNYLNIFRTFKLKVFYSVTKLPNLFMYKRFEL